MNLCETCTNVENCILETPDYVDAVEVTQCHRYNKELKVPAAFEQLVNALENWHNEDCGIECEECAVYGMCDLLEDMAAEVVDEEE